MDSIAQNETLVDVGLLSRRDGQAAPRTSPFHWGCYSEYVEV